MLTLDKIYHASYVLKEVIRPTDMIKATNLSNDCNIYLKTENLQVTGSFKVRGAYYKISQLSEEERQRALLLVPQVITHRVLHLLLQKIILSHLSVFQVVLLSLRLRQQRAMVLRYVL